MGRATLPGAIYRNGEEREPPASPPQLSQAEQGRTATSRSARSGSAIRRRVRNVRITSFGLLGRLARTRAAPRIVLLLWLGNTLQRRLVGLFVDLGRVVGLRRIALALAAGAHLGLRRAARQRQ